MKVLALGDPHGKLPKDLDLIIKENNIELIVCIGEVFPIKRNKIHGGRPDIKTGERVLDKICSFKIPVIFFRGNMFLSNEGKIYFKDFLKRFYKRYKNFYYKSIGLFNIKGIHFIVFDMIYETHSHSSLSNYFTDKAKNNSRLKRLNQLLSHNPNAPLLSHAPPYGYLDKTHNGKHVGSKILLSAIQKNKPKLVLCGHIHEAKGKTKIGKTDVYNLGCCGSYRIFNI